MVRNIKLTLEYDGTNYAGWQYQPNALSIQEVVERAISRVLNSEIKLAYAGRTDAGVHAKGQVVNFKTRSTLATDKIHRGVNSLLPADIHIINCEEVYETFHARFDAKKKYYRYIVTREYSPFTRFYAYHYPYNFSLDIIKDSVKYLTGTHDFTSFAHITGDNISPVRHIERIDIIEDREFIYFDFIGKSFLRNMIRIIVGTLLDIARREWDSYKIKEILDARDRGRAGPTAPSKGLFLMQVYY